MNKFENLEQWWARWKSKNGKYFTGKSEAKTGSSDGEKAFMRASWRRWQEGFGGRMKAEMTRKHINNLSKMGESKNV